MLQDLEQFFNDRSGDCSMAARQNRQQFREELSRIYTSHPHDVTSRQNHHQAQSQGVTSGNSPINIRTSGV